MSEMCERVQKLVAGRRAGSISMRQFKAQIENFTNAELACLAATLLETSPARRKHLERALLTSGEQGRAFAQPNLNTALNLS
jgi:hypothetical protein